MRTASSAEGGRLLLEAGGRGEDRIREGLPADVGDFGRRGAAAGVRLLRSQLFAVDALDSQTWAATVLILVAAGLSAAWIPARRAASVDPAVTLRAG